MTSTGLSRRGPIIGLVVAAIAVAGCIALWPVQMGGATSYVTTHGISMEPRFHTGDLAILRASDSYNVGDITAYHSTALHRVVMHRIVKIQNGLYTFKGDNNSWLDPAPAEESQLIGKLALRVPHGGIVLAMTQRAAPYLVVALILIAGGGTAAVQRRGRRKRGTMSRHAAARGAASGSLKNMPPQLATAAGITAVAAALGLGLLALAATAPIVTSQAKTTQSQQLVFSYSAAVGHTAAYDTNTATSPDPIFRKITDNVDVHMAYTGPAGSMAVDVQVSNGLGWRSSWQLAPATAVNGSQDTQTVHLNLADIDARVLAADRATGMTGTDTTVAIQPVITTAIGASFRPVLNLMMTPLELNLSGQPTSLVATAPAQVVAQATRSRVISIFGHRLPASTARSWSWLILGASLLSGLVIWLLVRLDGNPSEGDSIRRRYSSLLVRVEPITASPNRPIVDVEEMGTLVKLAERYGLLILHWSRSGVATFVVQDENTTYRYRAGAADTEAMTRRYRRGSAKRSADTGSAAPFEGYDALPFENDTALTSDGSPG